MRILKFIVRNILKAIDNIIDFINYITGLNISNLPKFPEK